MHLSTPRHAIESWAVSSQLKARRNAMLASTSLAQRRAERLEVDAFLRELPTTRHPQPKTAEG